MKNNSDETERISRADLRKAWNADQSRRQKSDPWASSQEDGISDEEQRPSGRKERMQSSREEALNAFSREDERTQQAHAAASGQGRSDSANWRYANRGDETYRREGDPAYEIPHHGNPKNTRSKKKKKSCLGRIVKILLLLLILSFGIAAIYLGMWDQKKKELPVPAEADGNILNPVHGDLVFLLAGVDDTGAGQPQRTDTLMLFRVNLYTGSIRGLSIPRDTRVYVNGSLDKVNHAHAYGGIELTMKTLRDFLGIDLDYYMEIDFGTVTAMIDAAGGVVYDVPEDAQPVEGEIFTTGKHRMMGEESLSFLRHRQGYKMGDLGRVNAQQEFMKSAMKQILSPKNFLRYPMILDAFVNNAKTNIPALPILPKAPITLMGVMLRDADIQTIPGEGKYIDGVSYYVPDSKGTLALVDEIFGSK
ncbi:MAG: LCP family protein [Peptoniphilaceae bacterium]|nr:LCP family protein [Peptoniphilaceae bacterium]MDD7433491.1 LCP family protein [Peptoniphilaceae bacterium]MDY3076257.1 LCP family protein [Peptoniphilaceae bacterium]MDY4196386.1 LCP family protein [Peptoniphilaceae bacterium]MDY5842061.1 LCP family protein [Peptoniphilaceae bacterium]